MKRWAVIVVVVAVAGGTVWADDVKKPEAKTVTEVKDLATAGTKAFEAGKASEAIDLFQKAVLVMQRFLEKGLADFLPETPDGWTKGKIDKQSMSHASGPYTGRWTQVQCVYTRTKDGLKVEATLSNSPSLVQMHEALWRTYSNPMMLKMMNQDPSSQIALINRDPWKGFSQVVKDKSAEAKLFIPGCFFNIEARKGTLDVVNLFIKQTDLKGLAATAKETTPKPTP